MEGIKKIFMSLLALGISVGLMVTGYYSYADPWVGCFAYGQGYGQGYRYGKHMGYPKGPKGYGLRPEGDFAPWTFPFLGHVIDIKYIKDKYRVKLQDLKVEYQKQVRDIMSKYNKDIANYKANVEKILRDYRDGKIDKKTATRRINEEIAKISPVLEKVSMEMTKVREDFMKKVNEIAEAERDEIMKAIKGIDEGKVEKALDNFPLVPPAPVPPENNK